MAKLKEEQSALQEKISKLESELSTGDENKGNSKEIAITPATPKPFLHYIEVQAKVDGDENITLSAEVPGTVIRVNAKVGEKVRKGTILAELDAASTMKAVEEAQNQLDFANTLYIKQKSLWEQKVGSEVQYLTAKNNYESAVKRMATLQEQLSM
ncbi:MAG: biotin/lipoyl-binding protein, partial [Bacteroidota bacterium]